MAKKHDIIEKKLNDFMTSEAAKKSHVCILVEGFERNKGSISFNCEGNKITIPIKKVLFPSKKVTQKDYVDFDSKTIWVFLKGTIIIDTTSNASVDCNLTCRMPISLPIITTPEIIQPIVPTYYDFSDGIKF